MAEHTPRILELLASADPVVQRQGAELVISLGDAGVYERILRDCRIDAEGKPDLGEPLRSAEVLLILLAHAPEDTRLPDSLRRENITALSDLGSIAALPDDIARLTALERLDLRLLSDAPLPDTLGLLPRLERLSIHAPRLTALPQTLADLTALTHLTVHAPLSSLPPLPPTLRHLDITADSSLCLPASIGSLGALEELRLAGLAQATLPDALGGLRSLRLLCITDAPALTALPDSLRALPALEHLQLDGVGLTALPPLRGIRFLSLRCSALTALPALPEALQTLDLTGSGLTALPADLCALPALSAVTADTAVLHGHILALARAGTWAGVDRAIAAMEILAVEAPRPLAALLRGGELLPDDRLIRGYLWSGAPQAGLDDAWLAGIALLGAEHSRLTGRIARLNLSDGLLDNPHPGDLLQDRHAVVLRPLLLRLLLEALPEAPGLRSAPGSPGLQRLPRHLDRLERLEHLILSGSRIIELDAPLPERLKHLDLSGCPLLTFPTSLLTLPRLRTLRLADTRLTALPQTGWRTSRLSELDLCDNRLEDLPADLIQARGLTTLKVAGNRLHILPDLSRLTRLAHLDLRHNRLSRLPDWLGGLPLVSLLADHNQICTLPDDLSGWDSLEALHLAGNGLMVLPAVDRLRSLVTLDLSDNDLAVLPEDLSGLSALTALHLRGNRLESLPESLWSLPTLARLDLTDNRLTALPWAVRTAAALRHLSLSGNPLTLSPLLRWTLQRRLGDGLLE
jgi:Leucine-rich repeat (LRR) protein